MMQEKSSEPDTTNRFFSLTRCLYKNNVLPSLNDLLTEAARHPKAYGQFKHDMEFVVINAIRLQLKGWKADKRIQLNITWGEKNKGPYRDFDNVVAGGRKIINDALTRSGTIKDDNPFYLGYGRNDFVYTDKPFIQVEIVEIEDFAKRLRIKPVSKVRRFNGNFIDQRSRHRLLTDHGNEKGTSKWK